MAIKHQKFDTRQTMQGNTYELFRYKDAYLKEVALHHHDFYEVFLIWSGSLHYRVEDRSYHMTNGDILLIPPGNSHQPQPEAEALRPQVIRLSYPSLTRTP